METVSKPEKKRPSAFKPGNNANPHGRPKKELALTNILREFLDAQKIGVNEIDGKQALVQKTFQLAMTGDMTAIRYLWERMEGPIKTSLELSGENGSPIVINIGQEFDKL